MRPLLVVLDHPPVGRLADFTEVAKQVQIENFVTERLVKTFHVGILVWLTWLDILDLHPGLVGSSDKVAV